MRSRRTWALVPAFFAIALAALGLSAYSGASSSQGFAPLQPVDFPAPPARAGARHELHLLPLHREQVARPRPPGRGHVHGVPQPRQLGSAAADGGRRRRRPSSAELQAAAALRAGGSAGQVEADPWVRIHKLPEYVHFPHMRHVNAGVTCQTCHGPIQTMMRVYQFSSLNMGWCVSCHVNGYRLSRRAARGRRQRRRPTAERRGASPPCAKKARYDCADLPLSDRRSRPA